MTNLVSDKNFHIQNENLSQNYFPETRNVNICPISIFAKFSKLEENASKHNMPVCTCVAAIETGRSQEMKRPQLLISNFWSKLDLYTCRGALCAILKTDKCICGRRNGRHFAFQGKKVCSCHRAFFPTSSSFGHPSNNSTIRSWNACHEGYNTCMWNLSQNHSFEEDNDTPGYVIAQRSLGNESVHFQTPITHSGKKNTNNKLVILGMWCGGGGDNHWTPKQTSLLSPCVHGLPRILLFLKWNSLQKKIHFS